MRLTLVLCLLVACVVGNPVEARFPRGAYGVSGTSVVNLSGVQSAGVMLNILKSAQVQYQSPATPSSVGVDANGYPTKTYGSGLMFFTIPSDGIVAGTNFTVVWEAGTKLQMFFAGQNTGCTVAGAGGSFTGCAGGNATLTIDGTGAGTMAFTPQLFSVQYPAAASYGAAGTAKLAIVRTSDLSAYNTYKNTNDPRGWFTPGFLAYLAGTRAATFRPMGDINTSGQGNANLDSIWSYRTTRDNFNWYGNTRFPPGVWAGGAATSGAVSYSAVASSGCTATGGSNELYTVTKTDDQPTPAGPYPQGTLVQGVISNTNTTTTPKLCFGSTAYPIYAANTGIAVGAADIATGLATFMFMPTVNSGNGAWFYMNGGNGLAEYMPWEIQIGLANYLNMNWWPTIPMYATDNYVTSLATLALTLNSNVWWYPEYSNEIWNSNFWGTKYAFAMGNAMGFADAANSFYSLRVRQIMGTLIPSVWTSRPLRRVLAYQGGSNSPLGSNSTEINRIKSAQLSPGNSVYNTFTGSANYTAFPDRAADVTEVLAYAPYSGGPNFFYGDDICLGCTAIADNATVWQPVVNAFEAGSPATAVALIDNDIRKGRTLVKTVTASGTTFTTPTAHGFPVGAFVAFEVTGGTSYSGLTTGAIYDVTGTSTAGCPGAVVCNFTIRGFSQGSQQGANINAGSAGTGTVTVGWVGGPSGSNTQTMQALNSNWYQFAQALAALFDGARPSGMANYRIEQYEGNLEPRGPTAAQCAAIGVTSTSPTTGFVGNTTNGDPTIRSVTNIGSLIYQMGVSGSGIPGGSTITSVSPDNQTVTMSANATATATGVSLTATGNCGTSLALSLLAWKNSASAAATQLLYYQQFKGLDPNMPSFGQMTHLGGPAQLVILGTAENSNSTLGVPSNLYGLLNGAIPGTSVPFKTYDGIATFNTNWLLKRDLNPASNDNDPMWLEKVA